MHPSTWYICITYVSSACPRSCPYYGSLLTVSSVSRSRRQGDYIVSNLGYRSGLACLQSKVRFSRALHGLTVT